MSAPHLVRLDYSPRKWQIECHRVTARFQVRAVHRRSGKTELSLMELIEAALRTKREMALYVYLAPQLKQAKAVCWTRLKQKLAPLLRSSPGAVEVHEADLLVRFAHNGAVIRLFGADNPDALRGMRLDGVVLDEVAQMKPELWNDIVRPALSDRMGWARFIGTPAGVNLFSELFFASANKDDWHASRYTVNDTDALDADEVAKLQREMPETSFAREYLCDFAAAGDDQLISLADVEEAARRSYVERDVAHAARVIGVDPARFGDDRSVIVRRQGLQMFPPIVLRGVDNMQLASRVASEIEAWQPDAVFLDSGGGAGVIDRLRQLGHKVIEVAFGGKPAASNLFVNRRSEMWWAMREWIVSGGAISNDVALKQELATPIYWYDPAGRRVLESKEDIKARLQGGASPDIADALALTFAAPVAGGTALERLQRADRARQSKHYDPHAVLSSVRGRRPYDPHARR